MVYSLVTETAEALCVVGDALVIGTRNGELAVHDAATGEDRLDLRASVAGRVYALRAVGDDAVAVLTSTDRATNTKLEIFELARKRPVASIAFKGEATALAVRPDGTRIYVGTKAGRLLVFER